VTIFVKQFAVCLALITKLTKIDTKLIELVLKCTKSELNHVISKLATKAGNLELEIDVQYASQAKLSKVTRKLPKSETLWVFLSWEVKCSPIIVLKYAIDQFRLLSQKMPKIAVLDGQNGKV
jgi:hypothetical protein